MPWRDKTGLAKVATILAVGFGISVGLCGVNAVAWVATNTPLEGASYFLQKAAVVELFAITAFLVGLVVVGLLAIVQQLRGPKGRG